MAEYGECSYRRFLRGDKAALEELVKVFSDSLVRYAYSLVKDPVIAEEVMEDCFAALFMKAPKLQSDEHLKRYLYRIAHNKSMDYLRRRRTHVSLDEVENVIGCADPQQDLARKERDSTLYLCMQQLPRQYREVLVLTYFDGFDTEDICRILKLRTKQVYNLSARAKVALRELLEKEGISHEDIF